MYNYVLHSLFSSMITYSVGRLFCEKSVIEDYYEFLH